MNNNPMKVSDKEVLSESNILRPTAYIGAFLKGDFRQLIQLQTRRATVYFEFCEN